MEKNDSKIVKNFINDNSNAINKTNEFIKKLRNESIIFQKKLKNILEVLLNKYQNKISSETLNKLKELSFLYDVFDKLDNFNEIDDFAKKFESEITKKFDLLEKENYDNSSVENDILWIPNQENITEKLNEKIKEINVSFLDGIKNKVITSKLNNKEIANNNLEIVSNNDEDVYVLNGKEISDEEFMEFLKSNF